MIQYINVSRISPHPNNPRKDLGDLTELAESIKINGILQNLTVVPGHEAGEYTVVIGHRRLAAAELAGEVTVPCVVSDMGKKQQVATMLLENIQRSDLTIFEQAQGFQMMLDFGDTVAEISKQTGFSDTTIRRRVKLMELDQDKLRKSIERGATLMDYAELDKIKDPQRKNKVLDKIGTPNFRYELQSAIDSEKAAENKAKLLEQLKQFATQVESGQGMRHVMGYYPSQGCKAMVPDDAKTVEYFFVIESYGAINLYAKREPGENGIIGYQESEEQKKNRKRRAALDEVTKRAYKLRCDFVREISNAQAKKGMGAIVSYTLRSLLDSYFNLVYDDLFDALGVEVGEDGASEDRELNFDMIAERVAAQPERHLLVAIYLATDSEIKSYYNWQGRYQDNEALNNAYDLLEELGYQISDEEQALRDGSHELFGRSDDEKSREVMQ